MKKFGLLAATILLTSTIWSQPIWLDAYEGDFEKVWHRTVYTPMPGITKFDEKIYGGLLTAYSFYKVGRIKDMKHIFAIIDLEIENELENLE